METGGVAEDTEMPHTKPKVEQPRMEQTEEEQPETEQPAGDPKVGEEQIMGEFGAGREPEVHTEMLEMHMELVPSGVVEVTPLRVDDSPLGTKPDASGVYGTEASCWGKGHSYSRKRVKQRGRKGTVEYVGSSSNE